jgi:hypothetical protein
MKNSIKSCLLTVIKNPLVKFPGPVVSPFGTLGHSISRCRSIGLRHVGSSRSFLSRSLSVLQISNGGVQLCGQMTDLLSGIRHHGMLRSGSAGGTSRRLRGVSGGGLRSRQRRTQSVNLLLSLLTGFLRGLSSLLGLVVLSDLGLELLLSRLHLLVELLDDDLLPDHCSLSGGGGSLSGLSQRTLHAESGLVSGGVLVLGGRVGLKGGGVGQAGQFCSGSVAVLVSGVAKTSTYTPERVRAISGGVVVRRKA